MNNNIKEKVKQVLRTIDDVYRRIQNNISPKGSYVVASIPFYFLYEFASNNIRINEKLVIVGITALAAVLNILKTGLAFWPIAALFFFSLWDKNVIIAIATVVVLLFISLKTKMVKKGKYQFPLAIMIITGCMSNSPLLLILALFFTCSLIWADHLNFITTPLLVLINTITIGTLSTHVMVTLKGLFRVNNSFDVLVADFDLQKYFGKMTQSFVSWQQSSKDLKLLFGAYKVSYIVLFIGLFLTAVFFLKIAKKFRIYKLRLGYILISHLYVLLAILILKNIVNFSMALFDAITSLHSTGNEIRFLDSFDNFLSIMPLVKENMFTRSYMLIKLSDLVGAYFVSIPLSLCINGYDSQKAMVSKTLNDNKEKTGIELGEIDISDNTVYWSDIAGYENTKQEIQTTISPYVDPIILKKLKEANMDLPKGILLFGPPGCGKTLFAKAIAGETHMNFISVKGNEFTSKWVGESEKNLREIFESARKQPPCVIFFDELEAFLAKREEVDEHNKSLVTTFLTEMDGFAKDDKFFVIGATNNPDILDSAAIRPGRFDKLVYIDTPNGVAREAIIKKYLNGKGKFSKEDIENLVNSTNRYSGADIRGVVEETFRKNHFNPINYAMLSDMLSHYKPTMDYEMKRKFMKLQAKYNRSSYSQEDIGIDNRPKVTWNDAAGMENVKEQIKEMIEKPLKFPKKYKELGLSYSKGILMYGPPGCGKTLVSKIIASEYDLYFIAINGPELLSKHIGESEEQIRRVFMEAKDNAPSVIFFDEFDSIAEHRDMQAGSTKIINQLLTEMDGNEELEGVMVIGATNRIEVIDPALKRPGRFDKILYVGLPNEISRESQFKLQLKKLKQKYDYKKLAEASDKFTCADIEACCKKIMLKELDYQVENDKNHISETEILDIINNFSRTLSDSEIKKYEETKEKYERE